MEYGNKVQKYRTFSKIDLIDAVVGWLAYSSHFQIDSRLCTPPLYLGPFPSRFLVLGWSRLILMPLEYRCPVLVPTKGYSRPDRSTRTLPLRLPGVVTGTVELADGADFSFDYIHGNY